MTTTRPQPSVEAIALLRDQAKQLDVEDLVDLCYARASEPLRTSVYLEALRGRAGEQAQVAACLLCFDLARRGDERREAEVHFLLPTLAHLFAQAGGGSLPRAVEGLVEKSPVIGELWQGLLEQAARSDPRMATAMPEPDAADVIEIDLFDDDDIAELAVDFEDLEVDLEIDDEALALFDAGLARLTPPTGLLFIADGGSDIDRLERLRDHCLSFATVPVAGEMLALTQLYLATHTRAVGLFGRRNKRRDRALIEGLTTFLALPQPPSQAAAWFVTASDMPGAEPFAWDKIAELLLDVVSFVGTHTDDDPRAPRDTRSADAWAAAVADAYAGDQRSVKVAPVLAEGRERRRRR
jgi:hypothetical protein